MQIDVGVMAMMSQRQQRLWREAWYLLEREKDAPSPSQTFSDYGFIVFPAAKVYEGYLKTFFYQLGLISKWSYIDEHFRIGKALNPDLPKRFRDGSWVFDDLCAVCSETTARKLWEAWKQGRNAVFHYQEAKEKELTLDQAEERLHILAEAMKAASECEVRVKRGE